MPFAQDLEKVVFIIRKDIEAPFREKFSGKFDDKIEVTYISGERQFCAGRVRCVVSGKTIENRSCYAGGGYGGKRAVRSH
ncbi:MAG: hypothetical protein R2795_17640 [Saprospiraceae bacterium]